MNEIKNKITSSLSAMEKANKSEISKLCDRVLLTDYAHLTRECSHGIIWTDALQQALLEHEIVEIPSEKAPYYIDRTVIIPSGRRIEAWRAVLCLTPECRTVMLRNEHTHDGTHAPIDTADRDRNISISGGCFAETQSARKGYGESGRYSEEDGGFFGVSTCMLFNNIDGLTLENVTFRNTAGFALQLGDAENAVFDNIWFDRCFADGLHINGGCENILARNIYGEVGDDLVALNAYDWQNSSVNFGAIRNVLCENLNLAPMSPYKALRMEPGIYTYDDGKQVDCGLFDIVIKNVIGIKTFKIYMQTPPYRIGESPEKGDVGSADNIFFDGIRADLNGPIDCFPEYVRGDKTRGSFALFELGTNIGTLTLENIDLILHRDEFPLSYLACIGPKSIVCGDKEVFDPYLSCHADNVHIKNLRVNGSICENAVPLMHEICFDNVNEDGTSSGKGTFGSIFLDSK